MQSFSRIADAACLDELHAALHALWAGAPEIDEPERIRFATAVAEIVSNIVQHGRAPDGEAPTLSVRLTAGATRLAADISDDGAPLSPATSATLPSEPLAESGYGLALAVAALDELRYARDSAGNHWELVIRRGG